MRGRDLLIGAGLVTAVIGLTAVFAPGVFGFSMTELAVTAIGAVMAVHATLTLLGEDPAVVEADTGDPETRREMPRPGDEADLMLSGFESENAGPIRHRRRIREWVTEAAVGIIAHTEGITVADARQRIADRVYASRRELQVIAGFDDSDGSFATTEGRSVRDQIRHWARWRNREESPLQHDVREAINTIGARLDIPPFGPDEGYPVDPDAVAERLDPPTRDELAEDARSRWDWEQLTENSFRRTHRETRHWTGMIPLAFAFGGVGVLATRPALLLAAAVGVGYAAYARHTTTAGSRVGVSRSIDPVEPDPGTETTVTLTIANEGDTALPDVRVVDGVPERLEVHSGVPRLGTALRPGEEATLSYEITATRGLHEFDAVTILTRDASGAIEDELAIFEETELACTPSLTSATADVPLRELAVGFVGRVAAERGGGVEFYAVREYRPGDPPNRIDWNRHARTGELATLEFREERSTNVLLLIDSRSAAYVAPDDGEHAVDRSVQAAGSLFMRLSDHSNRVGVASFGPELTWIGPNLGSHHERRVEEILGTDPGFGPLPPQERQPRITWLRELRRRLDEDVQVIFVTPMCDDFASFVARRLEAFGHPVSVLSPDPTTIDTIGGRLSHLQRRVRMLELRGAGIPVLDWAWDQPLEAALRKAQLGREP